MPWTFYTSAGVAKTGEYLGSEFPIGTITQTAATAAGTGWLFCDGSSLVRATYPELFTAIGVTYGSASGTTFTLPDLRGRVPVGAGAGSGLTSRALAATGGVETTPNVVPSHSHTGTTGTESADHSHSGTTGGHSNDHTHYYERSQDYNVGLAGGGAYPNWQIARTGANTGGASSNHTHNFSTGGRSAAHTHSFTTDLTGSGTAIPVVQPFVAINFMIYAVTYARRAG